MDYFARLTEILSQASGDCAEAKRESLLSIARSFFTGEKAELQRMHLEGAGGAAVVAGYTSLVDALIKSIYAASIEGRNCRTPHALVALGGYGREELCFGSDLDTMFVYTGRLGKGLESINNYVLHFLWDLGFEVGHSIRSIDDSMKLAEKDSVVLTSLLESRLLAGSEPTFEKFISRLNHQVQSADIRRFIRRKRRERKHSLSEAGGEIYHIAPNVKQTAGGLRDYHTGVWIALARFGVKSPRQLFNADLLTQEQFLRLEKALDFIWRVRNQMYLDGGSPEDVLTLSRQEQIARAFGYGASGGALAVELFMQDYYVHALELQKFYEEMLRLGGISEARREAPPVPRGGKTERGLRIARRQVYTPTNDAGWFRRNPSRLLEIIWYAQRQGFTLSESARAQIRNNLSLIHERFRRDPVAGKFFMAILSDPLRAGASARLMDGLGILDRYLPEFAAIRDVIRYDHFHQHPVNEHTLRALENIAAIPHLNEAGADLLKRALSEIKSPEILSLALLLHDLGKIEENDHVEAGVRIAEAVGRRLALNREKMDILRFLVCNHIKMTRLSRYRDLDDPEIIRSFAAEVGSVENLNMLYLLTYADLRAVRHGAWGDWISALLYRLYHGAREILARPSDSPGEKVDYWDTPKAMVVCEYFKAADASAVKNHLRGMSPRYLECFTPKEIAEHMRMASSLQRQKAVVKWIPAPDYSLTRITVCTQDRSGLFAEIVGTFASQQVSVLDAAVFTRADGVVIDSFRVVDGQTEGPLTSTKWAVVKEILRKALKGERNIEPLIRRAERSPLATRKVMSSLPQSVSFDNGASTSYTIIDVEAPDRIGLLYDIASAIFNLGLDISVARIATDERLARDAFYVCDREGNKIESPLQLEEIRKTIEKVLNAGLWDATRVGAE